MSTLDDKLQDILRKHNVVAPRIISEIKQAFKDEGYQPIATPVLSSEDNINHYYFDRTDKTWKVKPEKYMTGQEWYERFENEFTKLGTGGLREEILGLAKKAAGIE